MILFTNPINMQTYGRKIFIYSFTDNTNTDKHTHTHTVTPKSTNKYYDIKPVTSIELILKREYHITLFLFHLSKKCERMSMLNICNIHEEV